MADFRFPLLNLYIGLRLEANLTALTPGRVVVVESPRRLKKELSYGYLHALWWVWLTDGRSALSVPPGAGDPVRDIVADFRSSDRLFERALARRLAVPVDKALKDHGVDPTDRSIHGLRFACNAGLLRRHRCEAIYGTGPANAASIATARSVGFVPYLSALVLSSPSPNAEHQPPPAVPSPE